MQALAITPVTTSPMGTGGTRHKLLLDINIGQPAERMKMYLDGYSIEEIDKFMHKPYNLELNKKIPLAIKIKMTGPYYTEEQISEAEEKFTDKDLIEVELSLDGGILEKNHFSFPANECFVNFKKIFNSLILTEQGIYELRYSAKLKTDNPEFQKFEFTNEGKSFLAFTENGFKWDSSRELIERYVKTGLSPGVTVLSTNGDNYKYVIPLSTEEIIEMRKRMAKESKEAEERYKEKRKEKVKEKKVMHRSDVPHIFKYIIEFEDTKDVVKDTLKKYNIEYEFKDGKFIFRKSQKLRLMETNLKYKVIESIYEEITEEEQLQYNEELKSEKNMPELESETQEKDLKEDYKLREREESDSIRKSSEKPEYINKPIETGFVFVDGKYIDAPYIVEAHDLAVYINGMHITSISTYPLKDKRINEDPGMPVGVTKEAGLAALDTVRGQNGRPHCGLKVGYLNQHFSKEEARIKIIEYFKALPYIKNVDDSEKYILKLEDYYGETRLIWTSPHGDVGPPKTIEDLKAAAERTKSYFIKDLKLGYCIFYGKGGGTMLPRIVAARIFPKILETLRNTKLDYEAKNHILEKFGISNRDFLIKNFEASEQFDKRLEELREKIIEKHGPTILEIIEEESSVKDEYKSGNLRGTAYSPDGSILTFYYANAWDYPIRSSYITEIISIKDNIIVQ